MKRKEIDLKLDWLSFTYKPDYEKLYSIYGKENKDMFPTDIQLFLAEFPEFENVINEFLILSGRSHYQNIMGFMGVSDTCRIMYNNPGYCEIDMGVNVSIPSHGLGWLFGLCNIDIEEDDAVQRLFVLLKERNCHVSRIDLAFDDYGKTYRPYMYINFFNDERLRTKFKKITYCSSGRHGIGNTFYLGSRASGRMIRIYDKDFESKGEVDAVRYEFELHQIYAKDMFEYLIENKTLDFISYLRSYFEVIDLDDSNRGRCSINEEWKNWLDKLDFSEELPERVNIPKYTLEQRKSDATAWLLNACVGNIKGYVSVFGWRNLQEVVRNDIREMPDKYRVLLDLIQGDSDPEYDPSDYKYSFDYDEDLKQKNGCYFEFEKHEFLDSMYSKSDIQIDSLN